MRSSSRLGLLWLCLLAGCVTSDFTRQPTSEPPEAVASWEEGCEDTRTLLPLCEEEGETEDLKDWVHGQGVPNIHQFTLLIPEHIHIRIHSGGPRGGLWNEAWRQFKRNHETATPEEIYRHAGELIFRFNLAGPIVPYSQRKAEVPR